MSQLFHPYRAVGLITSATVRPSVTTLGTESFITCSSGNATHTYDVATLRLVDVGRQHPSADDHRLTAICTVKEDVITGAGACVFVWRRGELQRSLSLAVHHSQTRNTDNSSSSSSSSSPAAVMHELREHARCVAAAEHTSYAVSLMLVMGPLLLVIDRGNRLHVIELETLDVLNCIELSSAEQRAPFAATCLLHPATYVNKVLVGGADGTMQLWNVRTCRLVHRFAAFAAGVRCLASSPALDTIGVGLDDGTALVFNLRTAERVCTLRVSRAKSAVVGLSFRSDEHAVLAAATADGTVVLWDLRERRVLDVKLRAHDAAVTLCHWLPGEPVLVTAGADNAVRCWIADQDDGTARPLRARSAHWRAPSHVLFYHGKSDGGVGQGRELLTGAADHTVRFVSLIADHQSVELSQRLGAGAKKAAGTKRAFRHVANSGEDVLTQAAQQQKGGEDGARLPPVTGIAACGRTEGDWDNVVTCHERSAHAYTWSIGTKAIGQHALVTSARDVVRAVTVSTCGNFCFLGTETGIVEKFNMQSGRRRGTAFDDGSVPRNQSGVAIDAALDVAGNDTVEDATKFFGDQRKRRRKGGKKRSAPAHAAAVTAMLVDGLNRWLVTGSLDGTVKLWRVDTLQLEARIAVGSPVALLSLRPDGGGLLGVASDDYCVRMYHLDSRRLVRRFDRQQARVTCMACSADGRWLVVCTADGLVRTWDVAAARLIDWFRCGHPATAVSFSPHGDFIATAHAGCLGVFVWANMHFFSTIYLKAPPARAPAVSFPTRVYASELYVRASADDGDGDARSGEASDHEHETSRQSSSNDASSSDSTAGAPLEGEAAEAAAQAALARVRERLITRGLVTLSTVPVNQWKSLATLDEIKRRNKPIEPPKAAEKAPFFLPTKAGLEPEFVVPSGEEEAERKRREAEEEAQLDDEVLMAMAMEARPSLFDQLQSDGAEPAKGLDGGSRVLSNETPAFLQSGKLTPLAESLFVNVHRDGDFDDTLKLLRSLGPSGVDLQLRLLEHSAPLPDAPVATQGQQHTIEAHTGGGGSGGGGGGTDAQPLALRSSLAAFLVMLQRRVRVGAEFELLNAWLDVVLREHGDVFAGDESGELTELLEETTALLHVEWARVKEMIQRTLCLVDHFTGFQ